MSFLLRFSAIDSKQFPVFYSYPEAKESTHKIRGRYDIIEMLFGKSVDQELLVVKIFYFFFYSAFGSLFPLMGDFLILLKALLRLT